MLVLCQKSVLLKEKCRSWQYNSGVSLWLDHPLLIILPALLAFGPFHVDGREDNSAGERWSTAERGHPAGGPRRSPGPCRPREDPLGFLYTTSFPWSWFRWSLPAVPTTAGIPVQPSPSCCTDLLPNRRRLQRCLCCLMSGTMQEGGPASLRNGCLNSSCAVARCKGSRTSIESKKPRRTEETCNITVALGRTKTPGPSRRRVCAPRLSWADKGHTELSRDNRRAGLKGRASSVCR